MGSKILRIYLIFAGIHTLLMAGNLIDSNIIDMLGYFSMITCAAITIIDA